MRGAAVPVCSTRCLDGIWTRRESRERLGFGEAVGDNSTMGLGVRSLLACSRVLLAEHSRFRHVVCCGE